jgi:hypothetical protein
MEEGIRRGERRHKQLLGKNGYRNLKKESTTSHFVKKSLWKRPVSLNAMSEQKIWCHDLSNIKIIT